ncbi:MAG: hypothetical protein GEU89_10195 [Kiloniellaceae bacterium]|nr:hypothetical protein [Kiloniellaceae bacterium]
MGVKFHHQSSRWWRGREHPWGCASDLNASSWFARLPAVAPILLTAVALLVMVIREARRLWPYRDQYQLTELLADAVVVVSLMVGTVLCTVAAFSPAGLGRRRLPFWRQGHVERARSGNFGTADWMPISEAKKRLPHTPGIVVGEAYRVDQDKVANRPFNPKDRRSWGKGGSAPLLEYQCDTSSTHGLVFAGAGGFKSTSIAVPTLVRWPHSIITLDPSNELAPMTIAARKKMRRDVIVVSPNDPQSSGFNVLSWIDPETPEADDNVASVVQWIAGDDQIRAGSGDNHFFISQGRALVTCLLSDLVFDPDLPQSERTLRTFRERLTESETAEKERLAEIHENSASYQARDLAGSLMDMKADETFSGIYANAADLTKWLSTRNYADLVSGSAFTTQQLVEGNLDLFINIPLKTLDSNRLGVFVVSELDLARSEGRDHRLDLGLGEMAAKGIIVVALVGDQTDQREAFDQGEGLGCFMHLAGGEGKAKRVAEGVDSDVDLAAQAAPRAADGLLLSPPFAPAAC